MNSLDHRRFISCLCAWLLFIPGLAFSQADWLTMSDEEFAVSFADQSFTGTPEERYEVAWMLFARVNQQIEIEGEVASLWEAWPSDNDTFKSTTPFVFGEKERDDPHFVTSKKVLAGGVLQVVEQAGAEEVARNIIGYDYLINSGLNTAAGVTKYLNNGNMVQMPIGSVEIKAKWMPANTPETDGAYPFYKGKYALTGLHIMVKMNETPKGVYTSGDPSWFWTTFEFEKNPGLQHVRTTLTDQPHDPLDTEPRARILEAAGLAGTPFELYSPNGTQITFEEDGSFKVLGHTMMEDFAGVPENTSPTDWTGFRSSCHSCHATASWNVETSSGNPMPMPVGKLTEADLEKLKGYLPVDFMWPIVFHAK